MTERDRRYPDSPEKTVRDIRRATRRKFSAEEKIRIVLEGLRGEDSIAELCRKAGNCQIRSRVLQIIIGVWRSRFIVIVLRLIRSDV